MLQNGYVASNIHPRPQAEPAPFWLRPRAPQLACLAPADRMKVRGTIYSQEDPATFVYQVLVGMVRTVNVSRDGRRVVRDFHVPGDVFGFENAGIHTCSAETLGDVHVFRSELDSVQASAVTDERVARSLWAWLLAAGKRAECLSLLGRASALEKLAYFLSDVADRMGATRRLELPMSRTDIGDYLGLSSETVSRTFTVLRGRGLIATEGRFVFLLDREALRQLSRELAVSACNQKESSNAPNGNELRGVLPLHSRGMPAET
jgi:CRP-like cAMP-binding protein